MSDFQKAFVLISKIYGVADPVLNMGIPDKLMSMGYQVLPFYYLPEGDLSQEHPNMYWPFGQHILEPAQLVREHPNLFAVLLTHHGCGPDSVMTHYFREAMQGKPYLHIEVDEHSSGVGVTTRVEAFVNSLQNLPPETAADPAVYQARIRHDKENITADITGVMPDTRLYLPFLYPYADIVAALIEETTGFNVTVLPSTNRDSADLGRTFTVVEEYFSLTALLGDVFTECRSLQNNGQAAFLVPKTEGAEVDGQYSRLLRTKLDEEGFDRVSIVSPYLEDLLDAQPLGSRVLFWAMMAGDLIRLAPGTRRQAWLKHVVEIIRRQNLTIDALTDLAQRVRGEAQGRSWLKHILIVGEPMVLYNDYLNDFLFETLASQGHRVLYAPFSEAMWLFWRDHVVQNGQSPKKMALLNLFAQDIQRVHEHLGSESHFENDVSSPAVSADQSVGYYAGAFGRFRAAKVRLADDRLVDGVITATSTYENTGISLNVLQKSFASASAKPVLNLTFDGNRSRNDVIRCEAFMQYL